MRRKIKHKEIKLRYRYSTKGNVAINNHYNKQNSYDCNRKESCCTSTSGCDMSEPVISRCLNHLFSQLLKQCNKLSQADCNFQLLNLDNVEIPFELLSDSSFHSLLKLLSTAHRNNNNNNINKNINKNKNINDSDFVVTILQSSSLVVYSLIL